jgi:hypothetical protein
LLIAHSNPDRLISALTFAHIVFPIQDETGSALVPPPHNVPYS